MLFIVVQVIIIGFLYKFIESVGKKLFPNKLRYIVYVWAIGILILSIVMDNNFIWNVPIRMHKILKLVVVVLVVNCVVSRQSGYKPQSKHDMCNFIIVYPVFEEIAFRGMMLPMLVINGQVGVWMGIVVTSVVFALSHLQYYKLNRQSIRFMLFALVGGFVYGYIAIVTESILLTILLHIAFNGSAVFYSRKKIENHHINK